jgi:hypothetical protein
MIVTSYRDMARAHLARSPHNVDVGCSYMGINIFFGIQQARQRGVEHPHIFYQNIVVSRAASPSRRPRCNFILERL